MKKIFTSLALVLALASCKKDYSCFCTISDKDPDDGISVSGTLEFPLGKQSKKDADNACALNEETDEVSSTTCETKEE